MKLEVGMYVRTKYGITQYREYETDKGKLLFMPLTNRTFANIEDVVKASNNIIDLIEIGDYVNGKKVVFIDEDYNVAVDENDITTRDFEGRYEFLTIKKEDIKSIVTKEQFALMEYEVE